MRIMKARMDGGEFFLWYLPQMILGLMLKYDVLKEHQGLIALLYLPAVIVAFMAAVRRCHDIGKSGWLSLICVIPFAGWYLVFKKGYPEWNKYGPPLTKTVPATE